MGERFMDIIDKDEQPKNIIVTGGAGFLGSHLVEALLVRKYNVVIIDNMMTGRMKNLDEAIQTYGKDRLQVIQEDVINVNDSWWRDFKVNSNKKKFKAIFNFACPASPPAYQSDPIHTMMTCVVGTRNMLEVARDQGAIFVQASTSEIYGDPEVHPQTEKYKGCVNTLGPRACYDEGKRAAETLCMDYHRKHGVEVKLGRIFNTYGPRMDPNDGRVVSNFICQALRGEKLTVYGDGSQTRSFCYVSDLIGGFMKLFKSQKGFTGPVNLGNPVEFTMKQLADLVLEEVSFDNINRGISSNPSWVPDVSTAASYSSLPQDDPKQRRPDITLARRSLAWEPTVSLGMGLRETISYFRKELKK